MLGFILRTPSFRHLTVETREDGRRCSVTTAGTAAGDGRSRRPYRSHKLSVRVVFRVVRVAYRSHRMLVGPGGTRPAVERSGWPGRTCLPGALTDIGERVSGRVVADTTAEYAVNIRNRLYFEIKNVWSALGVEGRLYRRLSSRRCTSGRVTRRPHRARRTLGFERRRDSPPTRRAGPSAR